MRPTYRIKDWDRHFETAESRKIKNAHWVPVPNKHDGKGYRRISQHPDAISIFCAWNLILQIASKMPERGVLADHDGPLDGEDLAAKTGFPPTIFVTALGFLSGPSIGWITSSDRDGTPDIQDVAPEVQRVSGKTGVEQNRTEGNRTEGQEDPSRSATAGQLFDLWKTHLDHPQAIFTPKRERAVIARLKEGYSFEQIERAIYGCKLSPHNMGQNDRQTKYDDIELICRDGVKLERFIGIYESRNGNNNATTGKRSEAGAGQRKEGYGAIRPQRVIG